MFFVGRRSFQTSTKSTSALGYRDLGHLCEIPMKYLLYQVVESVSRQTSNFSLNNVQGGAGIDLADELDSCQIEQNLE